MKIKASTTAGNIDGELFLPTRPPSRQLPAILFFFDAGGLRPAMSQMGQRLADLGYAVIQPNLYWRAGPFAPFDAKTVFSDPPERQRLMGLMSTVKNETATADALAVLDAAIAVEPRIDASRIGLVGYCMGGRIAFVAAATLGERVAAIAGIHAGGLVTPAEDSPYKRIPAIKAKVYLGVADQDASCTPDNQDVLRKGFESAGTDYRMELYAGSRHGFAVPDFPVFDPPAAERHWERLRETFAAL